MQPKPDVEIYTDGACAGNPGPGGWGALLKFGKISREIYGSEFHTTNNQMEIKAAIEALKILKKSCNIQLYTDSRYLQQGITKWIYNWQKNNWHNTGGKEIKNINLWQELFQEIVKHDIICYWVKGHGDNTGNQIADQLAVKGKKIALGIAQGIVREDNNNNRLRSG